ncbi:neuroligin-4, X-linked-like isoform X1 [Mytilus californianus]|uniref:neuroligin-4, X-linked-like isoform X1 n=1 Tax=Mytilus californianus TaxID=6549 RepID=UPI0022453007|nr:neuroligin-4, X-linked-like isoform X1 [Mytilus californianus]
MNKMSKILIMLTFVLSTSQWIPIRKTLYGNVRGKVTIRVPQVEVEEYLGVPYASPPTGNLRYKRPQMPMKWSPRILDTTNLPPACLQENALSVQFDRPGFDNFNEDCLYMNIYVPRVNKRALPILLFIHGGSNSQGMGAVFDGDILAAHGGIIVITFNFRLDNLGFYADPREGIKGNNGLMDQVLAMKWIKRNIKYFNGDPSKVTIYGHSAGAGDAGVHLLSGLTKGLFRNTIIHSGVPIAHWFLSRCIQTSKVSNIPPNCRPGTSLTTTEGQENDLVVIDGDFLRGSPEKLFTCGKFHAGSVLLMMARDEGFPLDISDYREEDLDQVIQYYANNLFVERPDFADILKKEIKIWETMNLSTYPQASQVRADLGIFAPMMKLADMISEWQKNVYTLSFDYVSQNVNGPEWIGVQHGWDPFYVFGVPTVGHPKFSYTARDAEVSKVTMQLISDFVKKGNWRSSDLRLKKYNSEKKSINKLNYVNGKTVVTNEINFKQPRLDFWYKYLYPFNFKCPHRHKPYKGYM